MLRIAGTRIVPKTLLMIVSDGVLIFVGLWVASLIQSNYLRIGIQLTPIEVLSRSILVAAVSLLAMYYSNLYDFLAVPHTSEISVRLLQALGIACLVLGLFYYVNPDLSMGRGLAAVAVPIILVLTLVLRLVVEKAGVLNGGTNRVLILGTGPAGVSLVREIISRTDLNLKVVGFLDEKGENIGQSLVNPGIIGAASDVEAIAAKHRVDRVVLALGERRGFTPGRQLLQLKFAGINVEDAHSLYEKVTGRIMLQHLSPSWLIFSDGFQKSAASVAGKRTIDVCVSLIALVLTLPIMALCALAILLETGRPVLFRQKRAGLRGHLFEILKFRSMHQNAEDKGPSWAEDRDPRVTRVGKILRKFRLDELPQLFNVLRGEMSLIGPRPEQPHFCAILEEHISLFGLRHSVRPGITGWAQIKYRYGASIEESKAKLEYDLFYIKHMSVLLDMAIFLETAKVILGGRGAK